MRANASENPSILSHPPSWVVCRTPIQHLGGASPEPQERHLPAKPALQCTAQVFQMKRMRNRLQPSPAMGGGEKKQIVQKVVRCKERLNKINVIALPQARLRRPDVQKHKGFENGAVLCPRTFAAKMIILAAGRPAICGQSYSPSDASRRHICEISPSSICPLLRRRPKDLLRIA